MPTAGRQRCRRWAAPGRGSSSGRSAPAPPVGHHLGEGVLRHPEQVTQLIGPVTGLEVEQQRAAGVGDVGDVPGAARHPGDQVGVDGADRVAPLVNQRPGVRLVLGQPDELGAGEVGVEPQAGQLGDPVLVALVAHPPADVGGTSVLPHDRAPRGTQRLPVPEQHGLALVGDADAGQVAGRPVPVLEAVAGGLQRGLPDLLGGVLHPAGFREVLPELLVAPCGDQAVRGDHERGHARRTCIDGEDAHGGILTGVLGYGSGQSRGRCVSFRSQHPTPHRQEPVR